MSATTTERRTRAKAAQDASAFNALTATVPLWANAEGNPSLWIRWTAAHEELVESEDAASFGRLGTVARIVKCGRYGTWFVGDWRPMCATCGGTRQIEMRMDRDSFADVVAVAIEKDVENRGLDAALFQMMEALVECPACRNHPGWVVG